MSTAPVQVVGGRLFGWSGDDLAQIETLSQAPNAAFQRRSLEGRWIEITYSTTKPLIVDDEHRTGTIEYRFMFRQSGYHAILVSPASDAVPALLDRLGMVTVIHQPEVQVDTLVRQLVKEPHAQYVIGALFAKVHGFGHALRSIALWGSDVGCTRLFVDILDRLYVYRLELRDVRSGSPIVSIDSHGDLSFSMDGARSLQEVTQALRFLTQRELILWPK